MVFVCSKRKEELCIYSEIIAVEGLKKNRKIAAVAAIAMMEVEDQAEDKQLIEKLKLKLRGKRITRRTIINGGENRGRNPLYKRIKRIFPKTIEPPPRACPARTGRAGGGARACDFPVAPHTLKTCLDLIQLGQGGVGV